MTKIEVVTYDVGTHSVEVDRDWDVEGLPDETVTTLLETAERTAQVFAKADKSTDHVVYVRTV